MLAEAIPYYQVAWWFVDLPRPGAADHDDGLQPPRRLRAGRIRSAGPATASPRPTSRDGRSACCASSSAGSPSASSCCGSSPPWSSPCTSSRRTTWRGRWPDAQASAATVAAINHNLGLDRPILVQYGSFMWKIAARQPGLLLHQLRAGDDADRPGPAGDGFARGRRRAHLAACSGSATGVLAATRPRSVGRPGHDRPRAVLLLDADVPARRDPAVRPLLPPAPARTSTGSRPRGTCRSLRIHCSGRATSSCPG